MNVNTAPYKIKKAADSDIPAMVEIGKACYPGRDVVLGVDWLRARMHDPANLVLLGPNSVGIASVSRRYGFEPKARLDVLACRPSPGKALEALKMVRVMLWWAKERGAKPPFRMDADTGVDFSAFSARLGGKRVESVRYEIPF